MSGCKRPVSTPQPPPWLLELMPEGWHYFPNANCLDSRNAKLSEPRASAWSGVVKWMPKISAEFLDTRNSRNRLRSKRHITHLAGMMRKGNFRLTGEPILIDWDGILVNGQHRLAACVEANVPFWCFVTANLDPEVFKHVDQNLTRSLAKHLEREKETHPGHLAVLLRLIPEFFASGNVKVGVFEKRDPEELIAGLVRYPGLRESAVFAHSITRLEQPRISLFNGRGTLSVLHWLFSRVDRELAEQFLRYAVSTGIPISKPWHHVKCLQSHLEQKNNKAKLPRGNVEAFSIMCWNRIRGVDKGKTYGTWDGEPVEIDGWRYVDGLPNLEGVITRGGPLAQQSFDEADERRGD